METIVLVGLALIPVVICWQKGKIGFALLGLGFMGAFAIIGALRIAKPGSSWDKKNYPIGSGKYVLARERFPSRKQ